MPAPPTSPPPWPGPIVLRPGGAPPASPIDRAVSRLSDPLGQPPAAARLADSSPEAPARSRLIDPRTNIDPPGLGEPGPRDAGLGETGPRGGAEGTLVAVPAALNPALLKPRTSASSADPPRRAAPAISGPALADPVKLAAASRGPAGAETRLSDAQSEPAELPGAAESPVMAGSDPPVTASLSAPAPTIAAISDRSALSSLDRVLLAERRLQSSPLIPIASSASRPPAALSVPLLPIPAAVPQPNSTAAAGRETAAGSLAAPTTAVTARLHADSSAPPAAAPVAVTGQSENCFVRSADDRLARAAAAPAARSRAAGRPHLPQHVQVGELSEFLGRPSRPAQLARLADLPPQPASPASHRLVADGSAAARLVSPPAEAVRPAERAFRPIQEVRTDIRPSQGELPPDAASERLAQDGAVAHTVGTSRDWPLFPYWWEAPALCHGPVYYEEALLERYGYSCGRLQPVYSAAHFFGRSAALPLLMAAQPPRECVYTLGQLRPGP